MKHLKTIGWILCLQMSLSVFGQAENWTMPPGAYDNVNDDYYVLPTQGAGNYNGSVATNTHAGYTNPQGELLFFTVDENVYDENGFFVESLMDGWNLKKGYAERLILPMGNDCERFAIIYAAGASSTEEYSGQLAQQNLYYAIYDRGTITYPSCSDPNPYPTIGELDSFGSGTTLYNVSENDGPTYSSSGFNMHGYNGNTRYNCNYQIAATELINDCYYYVYVFDGTYLLQYKLDDTGFYYNNYYLDYAHGGFESEWRTEMELIKTSEYHYRIAFPRDDHQGLSPNFKGVEIYDVLNGSFVDPSSRIQLDLSDGVNNNGEIYGLEFDRTGNFLYITHETNSLFPNPLDVYDISAGSFVSLTSLNNIADFQLSFIERFGNEMYLATDVSSSRLGQLTFTDDPYSASFGFNDSYQSITGSFGNNAITGGTHQFRYVLPEQLDVEYTDLSSLSCDCCSEWRHEFRCYVATQSDTWSPGAANNPFQSVSGDVYIRDELIIDPGVDIEISGMNFYFGKDAKVIVRREETNETGSYLKLTDGTVFTADNRCAFDTIAPCGPITPCDTIRWEGIRVEGHGTLTTQEWNSSTPHGRLWVDGNSMIEFANVGALAGHSGVTNSEGGIIRMKEARVKDCLIGVQFEPFIKTTSGGTELFTRSYIHKTHFSTTSEWFGNSNPKYFVNIEGSSGIYLKGNLYENQIPNSFVIGSRGIGVKVKDSRVSSEWYCTSNNITCPTANVVRSVYKNLNYGVYGLNSNTTRTYYEYFSKFTNNFIGVSLNNYINPFVLDNSFAVMPEVNSTGLYLTKSTGYTVEGNHLTTYQGTSANRNIGIHVDNSGDDNNEIYRNTFTNISRGGLTTNTNSETGTHYEIGLDWLCNEFTAPIRQADIYLDGTMSDEQGDCNVVPAGNLFSTGPSGHYDLYSTAASMWTGSAKKIIDYNHHTGLPSSLVPNPYSQSMAPLYQDFGIHSCTGHKYDKYTCPVKKTSIPDGYSGPKSSDFSELTPEMVNESIFVLEDQIAELRSVIDGGDTDYILELISGLNTESNSDAMNELILIIENISGPISEDVLAALQGINNDMVSSIAEELAFNGGGMSDEEAMLNYYEHELAEYWKEVVTYYISDTLGTISEDEMIGLLQDHQPKSAQRFASIICPVGEQSWIRSVNCAYANNAEELGLPELVDGELPRFIPEYFESDFFHMPGNTNILNAHYIEHDGIYDPVVPESDLEDIEVEFDGINPFAGGGGDGGDASALIVSPNPFSDMVTFDLTQFEFNESEVELEFYDMVGRKVYQVQVGENQYQVSIDAQDLPLGFMTYSLKVNGVPTESGKILRVE